MLLLAPAPEMMINEVLETVDPIVRGFTSPVERVSAGARLYMQMATRGQLIEPS